MNKEINKALNELYGLTVNGTVKIINELWSDTYDKYIYEIIYHRIYFHFVDEHNVKVYLDEAQALFNKGLSFNDRDYPIISKIYSFIKGRITQDRQTKNENQFLEMFFGEGAR